MLRKLSGLFVFHILLTLLCKCLSLEESDRNICLIFHYQAYQVSIAAGEDQLIGILAFLFPIALTIVRANAREKKGIEGSLVGDFLAMCCCGKFQIYLFYLNCHDFYSYIQNIKDAARLFN